MKALFAFAAGAGASIRNETAAGAASFSQTRIRYSGPRAVSVFFRMPELALTWRCHS